MNLTDFEIATIRVAFQAYEVSKDGAISREEIRQLFAEVGAWSAEKSDLLIDALLEVYDENPDGTVSFNDFCTWIIEPATPLPGIDEEEVEYSVEKRMELFTGMASSSDPNTRVRSLLFYVSKICGRPGDETSKAIPLVGSLLADKHMSVRFCAVWAMKQTAEAWIREGDGIAVAGPYKGGIGKLLVDPSVCWGNELRVLAASAMTVLGSPAGKFAHMVFEGQRLKGLQFFVSKICGKKLVEDTGYCTGLIGAMLKDEKDTPVRYTAMCALKETAEAWGLNGDGVAMVAPFRDELCKLLMDTESFNDCELRMAAAQALKSIGDNVGIFATQCFSEKYDEKALGFRFFVAKICGKSMQETKECMDIIRPLLTTEDRFVRFGATWAVKEVAEACGADGVGHALILACQADLRDLLAEESAICCWDRGVQALAAEALRAAGDRIGSFMIMFMSDDPKTKVESFKYFVTNICGGQNMETEKCLEIFASFLKHGDALVRYYVAWAMKQTAEAYDGEGKFMCFPHRGELRKLLKDTSLCSENEGEVRSMAAQALIAIGDRVGKFATMIFSADPEERVEGFAYFSANICGKPNNDTEKSVELFEFMLKGSDPTLQICAIKALQETAEAWGPEGEGVAIVARQRDQLRSLLSPPYSREVRVAAAYTLRAIGDEDKRVTRILAKAAPASTDASKAAESPKGPTKKKKAAS